MKDESTCDYCDSDEATCASCDACPACHEECEECGGCLVEEDGEEFCLECDDEEDDESDDDEDFLENPRSPEEIERDLRQSGYDKEQIRAILKARGPKPNKGYTSLDEEDELREEREEHESRKATPPRGALFGRAIGARKALVEKYPRSALSMADDDDRRAILPNGDFWVHVPKDSKWLGPYTKLQAMDLARIASQTGSEREVFRGRSGTKVREYEEGKAVWREGD